MLVTVLLGVILLASTGFGRAPRNPCAQLNCEEGYYCQPIYRHCVTVPCTQPPPRCLPVPTDPGNEEPPSNECEAVKCQAGYYCQPQGRNGPKCLPIPKENGEPSLHYNPCANVTCSAGTYCHFDTIYCFTAPCPQPDPYCKSIAGEVPHI